MKFIFPIDITRVIGIYFKTFQKKAKVTPGRYGNIWLEVNKVRGGPIKLEINYSDVGSLTDAMREASHRSLAAGTGTE